MRKKPKNYWEKYFAEDFRNEFASEFLDLMLTIDDSGKEIPKDMVDFVIDKYYRTLVEYKKKYLEDYYETEEEKAEAIEKADFITKIIKMGGFE